MTETGVSISDLLITFGSYVQSTTHTLLQNGVDSRSRSAIWLGALGNATGGHIVMSLDTGKLLRPSHVEVVTMTEEVIGHEEKSLLTFQNRKGEEIGESCWLNNAVIDNAQVKVISDTVKNVTGVDQPYEEYADEWNEGVPEDLVEAEVQGGDNIIDQDVMATPKTTEEFTVVEERGGMTNYEKEAGPIEPTITPIPAVTPKQEGNERPTRTVNPCRDF